MNERVEFVRVGFHGASLHFRVSISDPETLRAALLAAGPYNNFDPERVMDSFAELFESSMGVEFGREFSPVLYVHIPCWTHQAVAAMNSREYVEGERISNEDRAALVARIMAWAKTVHADEITDQDGWKVRIWWD